MNLEHFSQKNSEKEVHEVKNENDGLNVRSEIFSDIKLASRRFPNGATREEIVKSMSIKNRYSAMENFAKAVEEGVILELNGLYYPNNAESRKIIHSAIFKNLRDQ